MLRLNIYEVKHIINEKVKQEHDLIKRITDQIKIMNRKAKLKQI